jgi:hypothetical protein
LFSHHYSTHPKHYLVAQSLVLSKHTRCCKVHSCRRRISDVVWNGQSTAF